jgi:endoglycosylceramidase
LQDYFVQGLERVVARFADNPWVIGSDLMNEPWPGAAWQPCVLNAAGCPDLEQQLLVPFYRKARLAAQAIAPGQLVFVEPFVLFNFGQTPTTLPGTDPGLALSFHSYQAPALVTEFGATIDPVILNRLASQMDSRLLPWLDWAYNESIIRQPMQPAGSDNLRSREAFDALVRPYPTAVAGTPTQIAFDPGTKTFDFAYDTVSPAGTRYAEDLVTVVSIPARHYPDGYTVTVAGVTITSTPCSPHLTLRTLPDAARVSVRVVPAQTSCSAK